MSNATTIPPIEDGVDESSSRHASRRLFIDAYAMTISTVVSAAAGVIAYAISTRLFDSAEVGRATAMTSAMTLLATIASLDLQHAFHRFLPSAGRSTSSLVRNSYLLILAIVVPLSMTFVLLFGKPLFGDDQALAAVWFPVIVAVWALFALQDHAFMGAGASKLVPAANTLFGLVRVALLFVLSGTSAYVLLATWIAPAVVLVIGMNILLFKRIIPRRLKSQEGKPNDPASMNTVLRFVGVGYVGGLSGIVASNVAPLLVLSTLGPSATGHFYMAWVMVGTINLVAMNFGAALVVQGSTSPEHLQKLVLTTLRRQIILIFPGLVVLAVFASPLLTFAFGAEYASAAPMFQFLAVGTGLRLLWTMYLPIARIQNRLVSMVGLQVSASALLTAAMYYGLTHGGLTGLGQGFLLANVITLAATAPVLTKALQAGAHRQRGPISKALQSLREDFLTSTHALIVNKIAGSIFLPRIGRYVVYRAFGMKFQTANIFYGVRFTANKVALGRNTFVNTDVQFEDVAPIVIGSDCQIGMETLFVTSHHDYRDIEVRREVISLPITVGDHCWIGARAIILPGVEIEDHCVIGAGAVVTKKCEAYGVYAGIPARRIAEVRREADDTVVNIQGEEPNLAPSSLPDADQAVSA